MNRSLKSVVTHPQTTLSNYEQPLYCIYVWKDMRVRQNFILGAIYLLSTDIVLSGAPQFRFVHRRIHGVSRLLMRYESVFGFKGWNIVECFSECHPVIVIVVVNMLNVSVWWFLGVWRLHYGKPMKKIEILSSFSAI